MKTGRVTKRINAALSGTLLVFGAHLDSRQWLVSAIIPGTAIPEPLLEEKKL